jgi:hypothetical protein
MVLPDGFDTVDELYPGQMAVAHQPTTAIFGALVGMAVEEGGHLRFDGLG